jgi:hypothetical protein
MKCAPARLWLLPAREAPVVLIVRRKPSRWWHFLRWDTDTGEIRPGAWHEWLCYPERCDISPDGEHMTFMLGWGFGRGVATVPDATPLLWWEDAGSHGSAGVFLDDRQVALDLSGCFGQVLDNGRWDVTPLESEVMPYRLAREGAVCQDGGWVMQPTPSHPRLLVREVAYSEKTSYGFRFEVEGMMVPDWAWYDFRGDLLIAHRGSVERYTLADLGSRSPSFRADLEDLAPPSAPTTKQLPSES